MLTDTFEVLDPHFNALVFGNVTLDKLWTGSRWAEGPAWFGGMRSLVWSDIPNNRMLRYDEAGDTVSVFRSPSDNSNGNTVDLQGRLVTCEHLTRRVTRTEHDGRITVIADRFEGKRLNSPNDVVVKRDGSIWFTDPTYGIDSSYEGVAATSELGVSQVYRVDPDSGSVTAVCTDFVKPNGLAFSQDERWLYVSDTGISHVENGPKHLRRFAVDERGGLSGGEVFATCDVGLFDGFRLDTAGHVWVSTGAGVSCYHPDGTLLGKVRVPEVVANVTFGGAKRNRLFICGCTSLYAVYLNALGAATAAP